MKSFSPEIVEAFNPNHGEGARFIEWNVRFEVIQEEIYDTLTPSADENPEISRIAQTIDAQTAALDFATFERGGFPLDGSKTVPPGRDESPDAQIGLIMNTLSDEDGYFPVPQVFTATTAQAYDLIAITLDWGFAPPIDFTVEWYDSDTLRRTETVTGNAERVSLINYAVQSVDRVVVTITRGVPFRFARITEFVPGAIINYTPANADSLSIEEHADPVSERAAAGAMRMVADNLAQQFNIFEPDGVYAYFKDRMPLFPSISGQSPGGERQRVDMGKYYLQAPRLTGNLSKLQINATNLLGTLQDTLYTKGVYKTATLAQLAQEVAGDAGITIAYPATLDAITVTAYIPSMSHAQAFADIARAANMLLRVSRDDALEFYPVDGVPQMTIGADDYRTGDGFSPSDDTIYNTVELEAQTLTLGAPAQLAQVPASGSIISSTFYADNAVIVTTSAAYYPKYPPAANLTASLSGGTLTITGQPVVSAANIITVTSRRAGEPQYVYAARASPLIQSANAQAVAEHTLRRKADKRRVVKVNYRGYPYFDMGDTVDFNTGRGSTQPFFLTKNRLSLAGGMSGVLEAREV